ncbi:hypothetical protein LCGC14_0803510 [marine sediment metagenome]|uniref:Uncharacterized protein n=1 Tax=marine sediment metagenome TaxID=412755 RepID=A0A0F9S8Y8_9ZZZZ|nr:MAG: hypothetical protein Lokiarch_30310 [Candidatus Lokiarchaeum sp. GC14_75]
MQVELISINVMGKYMSHGTATGVTKIQLDKKNMFPEALAYIEKHCNKNGFEVLNFAIDGNVYYYTLIKK